MCPVGTVRNLTHSVQPEGEFQISPAPEVIIPSLSLSLLLWLLLEFIQPFPLPLLALPFMKSKYQRSLKIGKRLEIINQISRLKTGLSPCMTCTPTSCTRQRRASNPRLSQAHPRLIPSRPTALHAVRKPMLCVPSSQNPPSPKEIAISLKSNLG